MKTININGEITNEKAVELFESFLKADEEYQAIVDKNKKMANADDKEKLENLTVNIFTNGGDAFGSDAICDKIQDIKAKGVEVTTNGYGIVASAGFEIFMCGDLRKSGEKTSFLMHGSQVCLHGDLVDVLDCGAFLRKKDEKFFSWLAENTKVTDKMIEKHKGKDWWFTYDEAVALGIVNCNTCKED